MTTAWPTRSNAVRVAAAALLTTAIAAADAGAHRLDEYLQASYIDVQPDRVRIELKLTPGVALAEHVLRLIDRDGDAAISAFEQRTYAEFVVAALDVRLDGQRLGLHVTATDAPAVAALRNGDGSITLQIEARHQALGAGAHELLVRNAHLPEVSVYLANALVPQGDHITVTGQRRNQVQSQLTVHYTVGRTFAGHAAGWVAFGLSAILSLNWLRRRRPTPAAASSRRTASTAARRTIEA